MSKRRVAVIGPEILDATLGVVEAAGFEAEWVRVEIGIAAIRKTGASAPDRTVQTIREIGVDLIMGPTTTPSGGGHASANVALRRALSDIVSDLCAGLVGGLGLAPGANIGTDGAVFEAVHGSAPDIAGKGVANPTTLVLSAVWMLRHLGCRVEADRIADAVVAVRREGKTPTRNLGGTATTGEFAMDLTKALERPAASGTPEGA